MSSSESDEYSRPAHYPFTEVSSSASSQQILAALLASCALDEISNSDDFEPVDRYIRNRAGVDEDGRTRSGVTFWLYPTGLYGPYHVEESGAVRKHGELVTIERGVDVEYACKRAREAFRTEGIGHTHIAPGNV
ncbi:hypothetical protein NEOLEDRAFT_1062249 [Neolentinus lepideus HHB14362 ss-1]|uniref:Uncharacterized protein n=1 Tax=Neolentinus lepideus HHB14362 ss-1 TaxID=1314782 RepID=A0A165TLK9_9AGAM|nr:hypothetical protein NEOLEDRAFT_1062249 [Neolentinus lepideus HHB14362 ss-1]